MQPTHLENPLFVSTVPETAQIRFDFLPALGVCRTNSVFPEIAKDAMFRSIRIQSLEELIHCVKDAAEWYGGGLTASDL